MLRATEVPPGAAIPDSIELELFGPAAMKGSGGTSDPKRSSSGATIRSPGNSHDGRAQGLQQKRRSIGDGVIKGANRVAFYDAVGLSGTWTRDIAAAITRLNYPSLERLCPAIVIHVDDEPVPKSSSNA